MPTTLHARPTAVRFRRAGGYLLRLCRFPMNAAFCSWLYRDNDIQACGLNDIFAFGKNDIALRATIFTLRVNIFHPGRTYPTFPHRNLPRGNRNPAFGWSIYSWPRTFSRQNVFSLLSFLHVAADSGMHGGYLRALLGTASGRAVGLGCVGGADAGGALVELDD